MFKRGWLALIVISVAVFSNSFVNAVEAKNVTSPFTYSFNSDGILYETGNSQDTTSPYWWLNSGAKLILSNGTGKTIQGELSSTDKWRLIYLKSNPLDTDNGFHPQNIFRLVTRSKWKNFNQTTYFKINKDELSSSSNRDASNGLLLMNRYQNGNNLYYFGIRVDGYAIMKKKFNSQYTTLASKKIFSGTYNKISNPNLLPKNTWIGLRSKITTINNKTNLQLFIDINKTGKWNLILETNDVSASQITTEGYAGIRTDFMDVEFEDYKIVNL